MMSMREMLALINEARWVSGLPPHEELHKLLVVFEDGSDKVEYSFNIGPNPSVAPKVKSFKILSSYIQL